MRILHAIYSLDPARGGPPAVSVRLAAAQAMAGHEVALISHSVPHRVNQITQALRSVPGLQKVRMEYLPPAEGVNRLALARGRGQLKREIAGAEIVHMHGVWEPVLRATAGLAYARRIPYIVRPAGMLDPWSLQQKQLKKSLAMALCYRRLLNRAAFLHALNRDERELVGPLQLSCPIEVIPNGVFLEELEPLPERGSFYRSHPELKGRPFILFLSRIHHKKGLDHLAEAFALVAREEPGVALVVAGPDEGAQSDFEARIRRSGLESRVHMVGPLYAEDKLAAYVDATCFCLPSRQEGFSVAITEALACGLPVVISRECHFPEVAEAGAGRVVDLDPKEISAALLEILRHADLRRDMARSGRELIESRFTWPAIAEQSVRLYERVLRRGGRS